MPRGLGCFHTGLYTEHQHGSSMPCVRGQCNHCGCHNGSISTTFLACYEDSCFMDGIEYKHGTAVPAGDGCNTCACINGKIGSCTLMGCPESMVIPKVYFSL
jgi:hypothetical protein